MPAVARFGDVTSTGHGCSATTTLAGPSTNVFCNTKGVERKGDPLAAHTIPGQPECDQNAHLQPPPGTFWKVKMTA